MLKGQKTVKPCATSVLRGGGSLKASPLESLRRLAFTMAEILLSLTIIGVVAAITLPSLTGNINERTWNTQRKALYSRLSQAIALMPQVRGYGVYSNLTNEHGNVTSRTSDDATEAFVTAGLAKVLKINNVCDNSHLSDCGIPNYIIRRGTGSDLKIANCDLAYITNLNSDFGKPSCYSGYAIQTPAAAFETANGESVLVHYNPWCYPAIEIGTWMPSTAITCANFIYDLNGKKGPNTVGKDIGFMTLLYPTDSVLVAPMPALHDASPGCSFASAVGLCKKQDEDFRLPNIEELAAMAVNRKLFDNQFLTGAEQYWSSTQGQKYRGSWTNANEKTNWYINSYESSIYFSNWGGTMGVRCIKRY